MFGVGGFCLLFVVWTLLLGHSNDFFWLLGLAPVAVLGAFSMLYGVGEWGRWAYLGVFLSIPLSMLLWFLPFYPPDKLAAAAAPVLVASIAYFLAKLHYYRRSHRIGR